MSVERITEADAIEGAFAFTRHATNPGNASCRPQVLPSRAQLRAFVSDPAQYGVYVARDNSEVVGVLVMHGSAVADLYLHPDHIGPAGESLLASAREELGVALRGEILNDELAATFMAEWEHLWRDDDGTYRWDDRR